MPTPDDEMGDAIAIAALQHYSYCPRQCALIHAEQAWDENVYTLRGRAVHEQVDTPESRAEGEVRVERALPLYSRQLSLVGRADAVEFLPDGTPFPVEYKHGPRRARQHDCRANQAQYETLERALLAEIDLSEDNLRFYRVAEPLSKHIKEFGVFRAVDFENDSLVV